MHFKYNNTIRWASPTRWASTSCSARISSASARPSARSTKAFATWRPEEGAASSTSSRRSQCAAPRAASPPKAGTASTSASRPMVAHRASPPTRRQVHHGGWSGPHGPRPRHVGHPHGRRGDAHGGRVEALDRQLPPVKRCLLQRVPGPGDHPTIETTR